MVSVIITVTATVTAAVGVTVMDCSYGLQLWLRLQLRCGACVGIYNLIIACVGAYNLIIFRRIKPYHSTRSAYNLSIACLGVYTTIIV